MKLNGSLTPGAELHLIRGIRQAARQGAPYVVIALDTEGGLIPSARSVVDRLLDAPVPVVVYLGPGPARAGSVGALLLLAADVAAAAPDSHLGGALSGVSDEYHSARDRFEAETAELADSVARARGRNGFAAARAVRSRNFLTGTAAQKDGVVDFLASDFSELTTKLAGWKLRVPRAGVTRLPEASLELTEIPPRWIERFLEWFAHPLLAFGLFTLGAILLWGAIVAGRRSVLALGLVAFSTGLLGFSWLPISYGYLAVAVVGIGLLGAEGAYPTYGVLSLAGVAAYVVGAIHLMDTSAPDFQIPLGFVLAGAAGLCCGALGFGWLSAQRRSRRNRAGLETLVGEFGEARGPVTSADGKVFVRGQLWDALSSGAEVIGAGALVVVRGVKGFALLVERRGD